MLALKLGEARARRIEGATGVSGEAAGFAFDCLFADEFFACGAMIVAGFDCGRFGGFKFARKRSDAVALFKADCRRGFRFCATDESVPAPEIALAADKPLAGRERRR
ncbi:MAG: hypothetical protein RIA10_07330 [Amphiplicatus sp.]